MRPQSLGCERGHGARMEDLSFDGAAFDHGALLRVEPVQTRGQQQVDRRRDREVREVVDGAPRAIFESQQAIVDQHADHLLNEQRVSLRGREDPFARGARQVCIAQQVVEQRARLVTGERFEQDRSSRSSCRRSSRGGSRAARVARHTRAAVLRRASNPPGARSDPAGVGSAQWMSSNTTTSGRSRARCSNSFRTPQAASSGVAASAQPNKPPTRRATRSPVVGVTQHSGERGERRPAASSDSLTAGRPPDDLAERVVGDPLPVRKAPAAQNGRVVGAAEELADEPRLAHARGAEQRKEMGGALVTGTLEPAREQLELFGPTHHRRIEVPFVTGGVGQHLRRSCQAGTRSDFPFSSSGSTASTSTASRTSRYVASPSRTWPGCACCSSRAATLTASPVTSCCPAAGVVRDDLARVHADADPDRDASITLQLPVQDARSPTACRRRPARPAARRPRAAAGCRTRP